jgi:hypothetical protein
MMIGLADLNEKLGRVFDLLLNFQWFPVYPLTSINPEIMRPIPSMITEIAVRLRPPATMLLNELCDATSAVCDEQTAGAATATADSTPGVT